MSLCLIGVACVRRMVNLSLIYYCIARLLWRFGPSCLVLCQMGCLICYLAGETVAIASELGSCGTWFLLVCFGVFSGRETLEVSRGRKEI